MSVFYLILFSKKGPAITADNEDTDLDQANRYDLIDVSTEDKDSKNESSAIEDVTEEPLDTLVAITRSPIQLIHAVITGKETTKHAKEISDMIGMNLKRIVKKFFKIANEALDNFATINNAGLVSAIVQLASFMTRTHSLIQNYVSPSELISTLSSITNLPYHVRLPFNLRSANANHEQFFDDYL